MRDLFVFIFLKFKTMVECQYNTKIKQVESDGAYDFNPLVRTPKNASIIYHLTCPNTSQEDGMVKSCHKQVVDARLALLFGSHVPMSC